MSSGSPSPLRGGQGGGLGALTDWRRESLYQLKVGEGNNVVRVSLPLARRGGQGGGLGALTDWRRESLNQLKGGEGDRA